MKTYPLPIYVQRFFTERLGRGPTDLQVADFDAELVGDFLGHVEGSRHNGARTRNARLSAIRSFFKYVALNEPQLLHHCQRILAMPSKRYEKRTIDYLTRPEIEAMVAAPDPATWYGRARPHAVDGRPADGPADLRADRADLR